MKDKILNYLFVACILFIIIMGCYQLFYNDSSDNKSSDNIVKTADNNQKSKKIYSHKIKNKPNVTQEITYFHLNFPENFNNMTKKEILEKRKAAVASSIFANKNYEPKDFVFGAIEDKKPWISINMCNVNGVSNIDGFSEESRDILNPGILVSIDYPFHFSSQNNYAEKFCNSMKNFIFPLRAFYDKPNNIIQVEYLRLPFKNQFDFYQFKGINARDLGYKYVYLDRDKSTYNLLFTNPDNVGNTIVKFKDFIHLGFSCGVEGGCNNASPVQNELDFRKNNNPDIKYPAYIYLKFWQNKPSSVNEVPDITEKIVILQP